MLLLACLIAAAAAAPATYDQQQDAVKNNVRADIQNVVILLAYPKNLNFPFYKSAKRHHELQDRADVHVMEAFVEPNTPYHVEIGGGSDRNADGDGRAVEVVIAGRRRLGVDPQAEEESDELKLLGATEQCGPDRERDPETLTCRERSQPVAEPPAAAPAQPNSTPEEPTEQKTPEVVPVSS